jgi:hypothetical protein
MIVRLFPPESHRAMTPEQRLDRIERIAKLFVREGLRARQPSRELDERINVLISHQIRNDEKFAAHEEKFGNHDEKIKMLIDLHVETGERFIRLAESQADTDRRLNSLIDIVREGRNGDSPRSQAIE